MTVDEFIKELFAEELSDMFPANRHIPADGRAKILPLMNTAMVHAYAKWKCKFDSEMLSVVADTKQYTLSATNVLQITQLVTAYGIDVPTDQYQVLGSQIYFPSPETRTLEVIFKVTHEKYTLDQDDTGVDIELPAGLIPWMKAYVCHRYFVPMKSEVGIAKAAEFLAQATYCEQHYINTNSSGEFTAPTTWKMVARGFA